MAATAILPYTIGKSFIASEEQFNIYIDNGVVLGAGIPITYAESRVSFDNNIVRGRTTIAFSQEYIHAFSGSNTGTAIITSIEGRTSDDSGTPIGIANLASSEQFSYNSICVGVASMSAGGADNVALAVQVSTGTGIYFIRAFTIRPVSAGRIYETKDRIIGTYEISAAETLDHGLYSEIENSSSGVGYVGIRYGITSSADSSGVTSFSGADSSVVFYRLLEDESTFRGVSEASAVVETIDDYWLGTGDYVGTDGVNTWYPPETTHEYVTIPKANRIVSGKGIPYVNANDAVVGVGTPLLVNEPVFKLQANIFAFEDYEPSFLKGNIFAGTVMSVNNLMSNNSVDSATVLNPTLVDERGYSIVSIIISNNERPRYGGGGIPPAVYGNGDDIFGITYASPRGSNDDRELTVGSGTYDRVLGGYVIGVTLFDHDTVSGVVRGELTVV